MQSGEAGEVEGEGVFITRLSLRFRDAVAGFRIGECEGVRFWGFRNFERFFKKSTATHAHPELHTHKR